MKRRLLIVLTLALLALLVAPAMAQDATTLTIALQQEPDSMSPLYTQMWFATTVQDLILAPAWFVDDNLNAVPIIASEIPTVENGGISADGKTITIKIRDNAVWSDGEPITSADFVFTYQMFISDKNTVGSRYPWDTKIASMEAPDPQTVVVTYNEPFAPWLATLFSVSYPPVPEHILKPIFDADGTLDNADWNKNASVTSGPYKLDTWEIGSGLKFSRNDKYFLDQAKIDNIDIKIVPDDATVVSSLITGNSDVGTFISSGDTPALKDTGKIEIVLVQSGYNEAIFFNMNKDLGNPALQDINVRKALVMLVDRDKINSDLNLGLNYTGASFWENTPYERPDAKPIAYDPEGAKKLLDDAGWKDSNGDGIRDKDGTELNLRYVTNQRQVRKDIQAIVQQAYKEAGIGVDIQNFDSDVFFASYGDGGPVSTGQYDIAEYSGAPNFPDPDTSRFLCDQIPSADHPDGGNDLFYCNPDLDKLFAQEAQTTDTAARIDIFHEIDQKFSDDVVWANMWYDPDLWAINNSIKDTHVSGADPLWNVANWSFSS